jgi:hypothetical protein
MLSVSLAVVLSFSLALPADDPKSQPPKTSKTERKPNPLAPSLPETTEEEEEKFDKIIDRFILFDTGKLPGPEGKKALEDFKNLPPESIFALIRGLNRAAAINDSCPALIIARRVAAQMRTTNDKELLQFARENVGAGVERSRHAAVLKDLKYECTRRQTAIANEKTPSIGGSTVPK